MAAPSRVGTPVTASKTSGTTLNVGLGSPSDGDLLVLSVQHNDTLEPSVSSTGFTNTWTSQISQLAGQDPGGGWLSVWTIEWATGDNTTAVVTTSSTQSVGISQRVQGHDSTTPVPTGGAAGWGDGQSGSPDPPAVTHSSVDTLYLAFGGGDGKNNSFTAPTNYTGMVNIGTNNDGSGANASCGSCYRQITSSTGDDPGAYGGSTPVSQSCAGTLAIQEPTGGTQSGSFTANAVIHKAQSGALTADALLYQNVFESVNCDAIIVDAVWVDSFTRTETEGLGSPDIGGGYAEDFPSEWSVDGSVATLSATGWSFNALGGRGIRGGLLQFDVQIPSSHGGEVLDLQTSGPRIDFQDAGGSWQAHAYMTGAAGWIAATLTGAAAGEWWTVKAWVGGNDGDDRRIKAWNRTGSEPDWASSDVLSGGSYTSGPTMLWGYGTVSFDNIWVATVNDVVWTIGSFTADASIVGTPTGSFTADAVLLKTIVVEGGGGPGAITRESYTLAGLPGTSGQFPVPEPSGCQSGDVIVVRFAMNGGSGVSAPDGTWTAVYAEETNSNPRHYAFVGYYDDVGAGSWTFTGSTVYCSYDVARFSGVDQTTIEDVAGVATGGGPGTTFSLTGVTTVTDNAYIIAEAGANSSSADRMTWDGGQDVTEYDEYGLSSTYKNLSLADGTKASHGATGNITGTINASLAWAGGVIALRPASGGGGGGLTADAVIAETGTVPGNFTANAIIYGTEASSFTADAIVLRAIPGTFAEDAVVLGSATASISSDAVVRRTTSGTEFADAVLLAAQAASLTTDAIVLRQAPGSATADAVIRSFQPGSLGADSIVLRSAVGSITADAVLRAAIAGSFTADASLHGTQTGSFTADALIFGPVLGSFTADASLHATVSGSATANAVARRTAEGSATLDAVVLRPIPDSLTTDAIIARTWEKSFSAAAWIVGTTAGSFSADAIVKTVASGSFPADAILLATNAGSFPADAIRMAVASDSFSADAVIEASASGSFSADAVLAQTQATSITADATVLRTIAQTFTADAVMLQLGTGSLAADARIVSVGQAVWTTPVNYVQISATPTLAFLIPPGTGNFHFKIEIDSAASFDTGDYQIFISHLDQTGWEYWDGGGWQPVPQAGVSDTYVGNEARYTLQSALGNGTWYRRVTAGVI